MVETVTVLDAFGLPVELFTNPDPSVFTPGNYTLMTDRSDDGTGEWIQVRAGRYNWLATGVFDGAALQLQFSQVEDGDDIFTYDVTVNEVITGISDMPVSAGYVRILVLASGGNTLLSSTLNGVSP